MCRGVCFIINISEDLKRHTLVQLRLTLVLLVQHEHVVLGHPGPALAVDVVQVDLPAAVRVAIRRLVDGATAKLAGLLHGQLVPHAAVHHAVRVHGARAHGEHVAAHPVPLRVHVVQP